jgi:hypothetical protein
VGHPVINALRIAKNSIIGGVPFKKGMADNISMGCKSADNSLAAHQVFPRNVQNSS